MAKKIVVDAGHGGNDSGAVGNGIIEKDLNLKISKYIFNRLKELGADVYITRDTDETLSPTERVNRVLNAFGNSKDVVVISNHINAGGGDGAEVIYALRNNDTLSKLILNELENEGQNIRRAYQRRLPTDSSRDYYFMQRNTGNTESVTVEYGFLDSKGDDVNQLKNNWENFAEAVVRAVSEYAGIPYNSIIMNDNLNDIYIVVSGDSLWSISKKFNVSVDDLKRVNNLISNLLIVGQSLVIPSGNDFNYLEYEVKSGDTLYKIAKKFNVNISDIMKLNNLMSNLLSIGQRLLIPIMENEVQNFNKYVVKSGDTLYKIANSFNTSVDEIKRLNTDLSDILSIGQEINIPNNSQSIYIVKSGDTLYSIANKYNISVSELLKRNNLISSDLSIGQLLYI